MVESAEPFQCDTRGVEDRGWGWSEYPRASSRFEQSAFGSDSESTKSFKRKRRRIDRLKLEMLFGEP